MNYRDLTTARGWLLASLGIAATSGCGSVVVTDDDDGGGGTGPSSGGSPGSGGNTNTSSSGGGSTSVFTDTTSVGGGTECGPFTSMDVQPPPEGECSGPVIAQFICFKAPPDGSACESFYSEQCVLDAYSCGFQETGNAACAVDFTDPSSTECCYFVVGDCPVGRPFLVAGHARVAEVSTGRGWSGSFDRVPDVSRLDAGARRALAELWTEEARTEHASIASFNRFVLQLLALGAPAELVALACDAAREELGHAQIALAFAATYGGSPLEPGALDVDGCLDGLTDPVAAAVSIATEGCIAETVSALQIRAASDAATDDAVRAALDAIATEEMRHAVLAWRSLQWLLRSGSPAMRSAVEAAFGDAASHVGLGARPRSLADAEVLRAHGCLPLEERRALAVGAITEVVLPCWRAMVRTELAGREITLS